MIRKIERLKNCHANDLSQLQKNESGRAILASGWMQVNVLVSHVTLQQVVVLSLGFFLEAGLGASRSKSIRLISVPALPDDLDFWKTPPPPPPPRGDPPLFSRTGGGCGGCCG